MSQSSHNLWEKKHFSLIIKSPLKHKNLCYPVPQHIYNKSYKNSYIYIVLSMRQVSFFEPQPH